MVDIATDERDLDSVEMLRKVYNSVANYNCEDIRCKECAFWATPDNQTDKKQCVIRTIFRAVRGD